MTLRLADPDTTSQLCSRAYPLLSPSLELQSLCFHPSDSLSAADLGHRENKSRSFYTKVKSTSNRLESQKHLSSIFRREKVILS